MGAEPVSATNQRFVGKAASLSRWLPQSRQPYSRCDRANKLCRTSLALTSNAQCPFTIPSNMSLLTFLDVTGAGGDACNFVDTSHGCAGGGGGASSRSPLVSVTPNASISCQVGSHGGTSTTTGATWFNGANLAGSAVGAAGGLTSTNGSSVAGGAAASGTGTTKQSGAASGSNGGFTTGGGGGGPGCAGISANGVGGGNGTLSTGGAGGSSGCTSQLGGAGGTGATGSVDATAGQNGWLNTVGPGGGGGGGHSSGSHPAGAAGGLYGAGGGGGGSGPNGTGGIGTGGLILLAYTQSKQDISAGHFSSNCSDTTLAAQFTSEYFSQ